MFTLRGEHKTKVRESPGSLLDDALSGSHLGHWGLVQIQLQALDNFIKVPGLKAHDIFGYPGSVIPAAHRSQSS